MDEYENHPTQKPVALLERIMYWWKIILATNSIYSDKNQLLVFRREGIGLFIQAVDDVLQDKPWILANSSFSGPSSF